MRVTVVTVVLNSAATVEDAIRSVQAQDHPDIEHVIIDGGSTDGTVERIEKYGTSVARFISEPDEGLYDAMNKGLGIASGEIVGILNGDDILTHPRVISGIAEQFEDPDVDAVYSDLRYVVADDVTRVIRYWKAGPYEKGSFRRGWHPPHPTLYVRKRIYETCGTFDTSFEISADFELMLRLFEKHRIRVRYLPESTVSMRMGGQSNRSIRNILRGNYNCYRAFKKNGIRVTPFYPFLRLIPKLKQLVHRES